MWLTLALAQLGSVQASDVADPRASVVTIVIHMYTYGNVPPGELEPAIDQSTRALRAAGIHADWRDHARNQGRAEPGELTLLLLSAEMTARKCASDGIGTHVLGTATPAGARAWIFSDRVHAVARRIGVPVADILGQVLTHEIGHLLLGDPRRLKSEPARSSTPPGTSTVG
jgi:hypothetical protein